MDVLRIPDQVRDNVFSRVRCGLTSIRRFSEHRLSAPAPLVPVSSPGLTLNDALFDIVGSTHRRIGGVVVIVGVETCSWVSDLEYASA